MSTAAATEVTCTACKRTFIVHVTPEQIRRWRNGELIQRAMPHLTAAERELFISGICGDCWEEMFGGRVDE